MNWQLKTFDELTADELYEILRLRSDVFVVEQNCVYPDIDGVDRRSLHLFVRDAEAVTAYLRLYPKAGEPGTVHMGRVVTRTRGVGLGGSLLRQGIRVAFAQTDAREIYIEAQDHARGFYAREGFIPCSEVFLEDGIPHVQMRLKRENRLENC